MVGEHGAMKSRRGDSGAKMRRGCRLFSSQSREGGTAAAVPASVAALVSRGTSTWSITWI